MAKTPLDESYSKMSLKQRILYHKYIYLILLPALVYYMVFKYMPIYGLTLAFKTYKASKGVWGSPWIGLENFRNLTTNVGFVTAFKNTVVISFLKILFGFPFPIILTLLINELRMKKYKNLLQTVYTFPHFISWVVVAGICFNLFSGDGAVTVRLQTGHHRLHGEQLCAQCPSGVASDDSYADDAACSHNRSVLSVYAQVYKTCFKNHRTNGRQHQSAQTHRHSHQLGAGYNSRRSQLHA